MNHLYILISERDKRSYVGSTTDLDRRVSEHNSGKCKSTKYRRPFKLVYTEEFDTISSARQREMSLKTSTGRRELKKIFESLNF